MVRPGGEIVFIETHERFNVKPSRQLQQAIEHLFGASSYYVKVDTSLPERAQRRWERRGGDSGDEE
jgi:U3 small nucleolar RNA-associated protein 14